jgi:hypothetical protein
MVDSPDKDGVTVIERGFSQNADFKHKQFEIACTKLFLSQQQLFCIKKPSDLPTTTALVAENDSLSNLKQLALNTKKHPKEWTGHVTRALCYARGVQDFSKDDTPAWFPNWRKADEKAYETFQIPCKMSTTFKRKVFLPLLFEWALGSPENTASAVVQLRKIQKLTAVDSLIAELGPNPALAATTAGTACDALCEEKEENTETNGTHPPASDDHADVTTNNANSTTKSKKRARDRSTSKSNNTKKMTPKSAPMSTSESTSKKNKRNSTQKQPNAKSANINPKGKHATVGERKRNDSSVSTGSSSATSAAITDSLAGLRNALNANNNGVHSTAITLQPSKLTTNSSGSSHAIPTSANYNQTLSNLSELSSLFSPPTFNMNTDNRIANEIAAVQQGIKTLLMAQAAPPSITK